MQLMPGSEERAEFAASWCVEPLSVDLSTPDCKPKQVQALPKTKERTLQARLVATAAGETRSTVGFEHG